MLIVLSCSAFALRAHGSASVAASPAPATESAAPAAEPAALVTPSASPAPGVTPAPVVTPASMPTPTYRFIYFVPTPSPGTSLDGAPRIREIDITNSVLYAPGDLHVRVLTSDAVVSVTAGTLGRDIAIPARAAGVFAFDGYIPVVPDFVRNRTFDVAFTATTADGRTAVVTLPLTLK